MLLKNDKTNEYMEVELTDEITYEDLYCKYKEYMNYNKIIAKGDNSYFSLTDKIDEVETVEFLDIRNHGANLSYQAGISFVFMAALYEIYGCTPAIIDNAMSKGLYVEIKINDDDLVEKVSRKMSEIISEDWKIAKCDGNYYKLGQLEMEFPHMMVPSASYVNQFEFRKYKKGYLLRFPHMTNPLVVPVYKEEELLFDAFAEMDKWQKLLGISYVENLNRVVKEGNLGWVIQVSESLHEKRIVEIAKEIIDSGKRIVLISGPSSSGKTTFAHRLGVQLFIAGEKPLYLGMDDYFKNREDTPILADGTKDFEGIGAVDVEFLNKQLLQLLNGEEINLPKFDFVSGKRIEGNRKVKLDKRQTIILEGIHCLNDELTPAISGDEKFRIYISPLTGLNVNDANRISTTDCRQIRRLVRDFQYRGKTAENTISSWVNVRNGEEENIFPYNNKADAFFNSVHIYEMCVLKPFACELLEGIGENQPEYAEAQRLLKFLDLFESYDENRYIPCNSILREFIGGSILTK